MPPINVTVDANDVVTCDPDRCDIRGRNQTLRFKLETDGYVFPKGEPFGINGLGPPVFTRFVRIPTGKQVTVLDQNPGPQQGGPQQGDYIDHKYTVTVVTTADPPKEFSVDPRIRNYG